MAKSREREMQQAYEEAWRSLPSLQDLYGQYAGLGAAGRGQLGDYYSQISQDIGQQFTPAMRMAQSRLAGAPLLADSGYSNRLNRQLQQGAFTDLSSRYGGAANELAGGNLAALRQMLAQHQGAQQGLAGQYLGSRLERAGRPEGGGIKGFLGQALGTVGGAFLGGGLGGAAPRRYLPPPKEYGY